MQKRSGFLGRLAGKTLALAAVGALVLAVSGPAWAQRPLPPVGRVVDEVGALTGQQRAALEEKLAAFEQHKGSQIAILLISTTGPEAIEEFGIRLAEAWKLGRKGVDDGAIVMAALKDRHLRIEVGYGLEGVLPDAVTKRIIAEILAPQFRRGDYYGGLDAAVDRMIRVIEGEPLPAPKARAALRGIGGTQLLALLVAFAVGYLALKVAAARLPHARTPFSIGAGGWVGVVAWAVFASLGVAIIVGLIGWLMGQFVFARQSGGGGLGGFGGGLPLGWGGFGRGGGGFSGGGDIFSGGGGGFGGGGASGDY